MATYDNDLRLKEITTGDEDGTWGTSTNTNLELITDALGYGTKAFAADSNETFTMPDATADGTRSLYLKFTSGVSLTSTRTATVGPNTISKVWMVENATTGGQSIIIKQGAGAEVTIATGEKTWLYTDGAGAGAAVALANPTETGTGTVTSVQVAGGTTGLTYSGGPITTSGTITTAGTLAAANGGTGLTSPGASGNVLKSDGAGAWTSAADSDSGTVTSIATTGTVNGITLTGGTITTTGTLTLGGTLSGVDLTSQVTGTLPVANGGTGITSLGTGIATWWGTPSSANLASAVTDETGSGALVFGTAPTLTGVTLAGAVTGADNTVTAVNLKDYGEVTNAIGATGGGTQDINLTLGNSVSATVDTSANTFTFSNPTASDELCGFTLTLTNGGSQTVNWPASVDWAAATAPTLTAAGIDILVFYTIDGGTIWYGFLSGAAMA
tara:strand:- start:1106 stop:2431 length:1326 start_codon:yes stop_codon:yes gene_type:complete